jgi:3-oxoacyl-[acyl-carrier protein] reductase
MGQLTGKVAIVTGAGSGFGEGIAQKFVHEGAQVVLADINEQAVLQVAAPLGAAASAIACDVSRADQVARMVQHCVSTFGRVDIMVNNAGIAHRNRPMLEVDEAEFERLFDVNVRSIFLTAHQVVPIMRRQGQGVILNVGSTAGIRPRPGLTWYNATKGAVNLVSKSMAVELGPDNIRVNALCPVAAATGMFELFLGEPDTPQARAKFLSTIPMGRFCTPADLAGAAVYLASDAANFISGVEFPVDGARTV